MYTKRLHRVFSLALVFVILFISSAPASLVNAHDSPVTPENTIAPSPPSPGFQLSFAYAESLPAGTLPAELFPPGTALPETLPSSPDDANGLFPDRWFTARATFTSTNLVDEDLHFTVKIPYPHPYVDYYTGAPTPLGWNQYVSTCTHDANNHEFNCQGAFPKSDPTQEMVGWVEFALIGTCSLYEQPRPTEITINALITYIESPGTDTANMTMAVEPPINMALLPPSTPPNGAEDVLIEDENHQGPKLKWRSYETLTCANTDPINPITQDIAYAVFLRKKGGAWQQVGQFPNCSLEIQLSKDALSCLPQGEPAPYEWDVRTVDLRYVQCGAIASHVQKFTTGSCRPELDVKPQYSEYFLSGVGLQNTYRAEVDWNGTAFEAPAPAPYGKVSFDLNGDAQEVDGLAWGVHQAYNMGSDFNSSLLGGNNILRIKATANDGSESLETILQPMVFPIPEWLLEFALGNFTIDLKSLTVSYGREMQYPDPAFKAKYQVPGWIPYLGGANMGILDTYATVGAEVSSDGSGSASLGGNTGAQVTENNMVGGGIHGQGEVQIGAPKGLDLTGATFGLKIYGKISKEMGIADLVPAIKAAEEWWLVGRLVKWFNQRASIEAAIKPKIEISTEFKNVNDHLSFDSGTGVGLIDLALTLSLEVLESLKASITGGGTPRVVVQVPAQAPWGYLKEIAIRLYAKVAITVWRFEEEWERGITCSLPNGRCVGDEGESLMRRLAEASGWQLMGRDYVTDDYARFTANQRIGRAALQATQESQLVSNVYPLANPGMAVRDDGHMVVLWIHDDAARPVAQGEEIYAAHWNGSEWSTSTLTSDAYQDFAPQVAFDAEGDAVAVWERNNTVHISPTLDITYVQSFEIASAEWLSGTASWSNVVTLTNDSLLDTAPQLARGQQDGALLALWRSNDGHDLLGTAAHPVTLTYATWDGSNWSAPAPALSNLTDTLDVELAVYSATQAALVLVRDTDDDLLTGSDTELYYATWDGATWSGPTQLTSDVMTDTAPALSYDSAGNAVLVWQRGDDLVMQTNWAGSPSVVRERSTSGAFLDFELLPDADDNLALLWQALSLEGPDVNYAIYDAGNGVWGADNTLMQDSALEESFAPAFGSDGTLYIAYNKVTMELVTETIALSPTLTISVTNIPVPVQTDLYLLSHTLERDLAISSADLALSVGNPAPGGSVTISATVHNRGDLAITGGAVAFYDGDPAAGGTQIGITQMLTSPFRAATTDTLSVQWDVPAGGNPHTLYVVVDPADSIAEDDELNNQATLQAVQPDLSVAWAHSTNSPAGITLTTAISNVGYVTVSDPFTLAFRSGDPDSGALLGTVVVHEALSAETSLSVSLRLTEVTGLGDIFWVIADSSDAIAEASESNNTGYAALNALPDLALDASDIQAGSQITITVHNIGVMTATDAVLAASQDSLSGTLLYSETLGTLGPGACATVTFSAAGAAELWAKVDPDDRITESRESNNVAVRGPFPPRQAQLAGAATAPTHVATTFTATVSPASAVLPLTYTWEATDLATAIHIVGAANDTIALTWDTAGPKIVTVTVSNETQVTVSATHAITVGVGPTPPQCNALDSVAITGLGTGDVGISYTFTATVTPLTGTQILPVPLPITYTWAATEQAPVQHVTGSLLDTVSYVWSTGRSKIITVTAINPCGQMVTGTHTISIRTGDYAIYLPLILKKQEQLSRPTRYVKRYGESEGDCSTPETACATIQYAIDQAQDGDVIAIAGYEEAYAGQDNPEGNTRWTYWATETRPAPGDYWGPEEISQVAYIDKSITLRGGYSADFSTWDPAIYRTVLKPDLEPGTGEYFRVVFITPDAVPTLEWLYILEGNADLQGGVYWPMAPSEYTGGGGGIYADGAYDQENAPVSIRHCVIEGNVGDSNYNGAGGGLFLHYRDNVQLVGNTIRGNIASSAGGPEFGAGGGIMLMECANAALEDNVFVNNAANTGYGRGIGGGVRLVECDNANLTGNQVYSNTANEAGGGLEARFSESLSLRGNILHHNSAGQNVNGIGGGIDLFALTGVTLQGNTIYSNTATVSSAGDHRGLGGGVYLSDVENVLISGNIITGNVANPHFEGSGGGLSLFGVQNVQVTQNLIQGNHAAPEDPSYTWSTGGGLRVAKSSDITLINNIIVQNQAPGGGDGIVIASYGDYPAIATLLHNTIADNGVGAQTQNSVEMQGSVETQNFASLQEVRMKIDTSPTYNTPANTELWTLLGSPRASVSLQSATQTEGHGIRVEPNGVLTSTNTIISGHGVGVYLPYPDSSTVTLNYTLWYDNVTDYSSGISHTNDVSGDPAFADPASGDYHIGAGSAAVDTGTDVGVNTDFDGNSRPYGSGYDIGADEYAGGGIYD